jgi:hypothetical protein
MAVGSSNYIEIGQSSNWLLTPLPASSNRIRRFTIVSGSFRETAHETGHAGIGRLIVSHIGRFDLDAAIAELKRSYAGPLIIGADLQCTPIAR